MGRRHPLKSVQCRYWDLIAEGIPPKVAGRRSACRNRLVWCGSVNRGGVKPILGEPRGQKRSRLRSWSARSSATCAWMSSGAATR